MSESNRPLSPHLQVYRLPLLALLSITHRMTGVSLSLGVLLLPVFVIAIANGAESYAAVHAHLTAWYGRIFLFLLSLGLNYHLLNGIRHLFWDAGLSLEVKNAERSGYILFVMLIILTAAIWLVV